MAGGFFTSIGIQNEDFSEKKIFNDNVHGHMQFHPLIVMFVDTRQIQRLRHLKQLGVCYFIFPSASHSRFEHSLGTAYIAGELFESLRQKGLPSDIPDDVTYTKKKLCVQLAALCHDLGHGPFSHSWEKFINRVKPNKQWTVLRQLSLTILELSIPSWLLSCVEFADIVRRFAKLQPLASSVTATECPFNSQEGMDNSRIVREKHEEESVRILDEIMKEKVSPTKKFHESDGQKFNTVQEAFYFYGLTDKDLETIKAMILGRQDSKNYMYQIVNNKYNDIDVDKWDYLARDSTMLNVPIAFDYKRLLNYCCVLPDEEGNEQICFREKEACVLVEMFLARGRLHDKAYQHKKVKIVEHMLVDAFVYANERLKLSETPITELTDHIFQKILYEDFGDDENMLKAKQILKRIEIRHLYQCIARDSIEPYSYSKLKYILEQTPALEPFKNDIEVCFIYFDMTKSNEEKVLKNVLVYQGTKRECKKFDWDLQQDLLKFNLENLKRSQVLFLYKGKNEIPKNLRQNLVEYLKEINSRLKEDIKAE